MTRKLSRRTFCRTALAGAGILALRVDPTPASEEGPLAGKIPLVDYHVHRDGTTVEKLLEISRQRGVKFGIVEHAGTKENEYPIILSNDDELGDYVASLEGKPVFKGVQAEWLDWAKCFSKEAVAQLDYVLTDAMTVRDKQGKRVKMWIPGFEVGAPQRFMDEHAEFYAEIMATEPIDIMANPTWLPKQIEKQYDELWTPRRMQKVIDAAVKYRVAIEINSQYRLPRLPFLRMAKQAGVKFSFGSNIRGRDVGKLDYCVEMAQAIGLTRQDIFTPALPGQKPIQTRKQGA